MLWNHALDRLLRCIDKMKVALNIYEEAALAYEHTASSSPLFRLFVDAFCTASLVGPESPEIMRRYLKEFLVDVIFRNVDARFYSDNINNVVVTNAWLNRCLINDKGVFLQICGAAHLTIRHLLLT